MRLALLTLVAALLIGASATANASRRYYLVGVRHIYRIRYMPDVHENDRQAIEEDYAGAINAAQSQYDKDMRSISDEEAQDGGRIHQEDRDAVQTNVEQDTAVAADQRDAALSQLYEQCDYVRDLHPQLVVDQDGPYRVMGIDVGPSGAWMNVYFYRPYPLYVDVCPFGWAWGRPYTFVSFGLVFTSYHEAWIAGGCPVFFGLCFGGHPCNVFVPMRREVIVNRNLWVGGRPPAFSAQSRSEFQRNLSLQASHGSFQPRSYQRPMLGGSSSRGVGTSGRSGASGGSQFGRGNQGTSNRGPAIGSHNNTNNGSKYGRGGSSSGSGGVSGSPPRSSGGTISGFGSGRTGQGSLGSSSSGSSKYSRSNSGGFGTRSGGSSRTGASSRGSTGSGASSGSRSGSSNHGSSSSGSKYDRSNRGSSSSSDHDKGKSGH